MFKSYSMRVKLLDFLSKSVTTQRFLSCLFPPHVVFRSFCQDSIPLMMHICLKSNQPLVPPKCSAVPNPQSPDALSHSAS